jgi:uncharacterized protein (DUF2147 family)
MRKLLAVAALLLASSAAQAQYTFDYGGKTIRIDPDRGTVQIPGVYDNTKKAKKSKSEDAPAAKSKETTTTTAAPPPAAAPAEQQPAAAAAPPPAPAQAAVAAPAAPPIQAPVPPPLGASSGQSTATAATAPSANSVVPSSLAPPPPVQQSVAPPPPAAAAPPPAPTVAAVPPVAPPPAPRAAPAVASNSPIGVWLTEEKEGKVRIEQCGANLCGYSVDKKTNQNGEQILINMKPGKDKWSGRILDPNTGSTYDSTIAMKGTETLRVQGCAFGGVFCGGQTWTRVN